MYIWKVLTVLNLTTVKVEREANTFDVTFKFNNIDFEYLINEEYKG